MRIALALGSGGARGYTHIGVLQELRERGHQVVAISGTSMGAVVGGLEAAGRLDAFTAWVSTLKQTDVWRLLDPAFTGPGVFWGQRVMSRVADILDGAQIEDLPIPFTAVATDLTNSREVWFQRGSVATAMRASIGIPSVFTPVVVGGRLLADGGLLNPVPVDPLHGVPADRTIAVSLAGRRAGGLTGRPVTETASNEGFMGELSGWFRRGVLESGAVRNWRDRWTERFFPADAPRAVEAGDTTERSPDFDFGELPKGLKLGDVVSLSLETAEALITRFRLAASPPDTLIEFGQDMASTFDFHRAAELIEIGRTTAAHALDEAGL